MENKGYRNCLNHCTQKYLVINNPRAKVKLVWNLCVVLDP